MEVFCSAAEQQQEDNVDQQHDLLMKTQNLAEANQVFKNSIMHLEAKQKVMMKTLQEALQKMTQRGKHALHAFVPLCKTRMILLKQFKIYLQVQG